MRNTEERVAKWDARFVELARYISGWSKDKSRQIGCVIVGPNNEIRSTGYNGFPRGVNDDVEARHERPAKYMWTEHAERNAIYNAARCGTSLEDSTIFMHWYPCIECTRAIIQCGIWYIVAIEPDWNDPKYGEEFRTARAMLEEAGVGVTFVAGEAPKQMALNSAHACAQGFDPNCDKCTTVKV